MEINMEYIDVKVNSERWLNLEDLLNEEWRDIEGYENYFQISNYGRVKALQIELNCKIKNNSKRIKKAKIKVARFDKDGYLKVTLWKENVSKSFFVHRLVAKAFIPNPNNLPIVNHKDGIKQNNRPYNLEWCTIQYNTQHAIETGLRNLQDSAKYLHPNYGKDNNKSRAVIVYDLNDNYIGKFDCMREAKEKLGLKHPSQTSHIGCCCRGKIKTAYGYKWRYAD